MILRLVFSLLFIVSNTEYTYSQSRSDTLIWSDNQQLEWSDFQGKMDTIITTDANSTAKAASSISFMYSETYFNEENWGWCYKIVAIFIPKDSWCLDKNDILLQHEQLHFDIMELTIRKLRKRVYELDGILSETRFQEIINLAESEFNLQSDNYDKETLFGTDIKQQLFWENKIARELKELEKYKLSKFICVSGKK